MELNNKQTAAARNSYQVVTVSSRRVLHLLWYSIPEGNLFIRIHVSRIKATRGLSVIARRHDEAIQMRQLQPNKQIFPLWIHSLNQSYL